MKSKRNLLLLILIALLAAPLAAQEYKGRVEGLKISVWTYPDKEEIGQLRPGDVLRLDPRDKVMLRVFSPRDENPTGERQYLSARWDVAKGDNYTELSDADTRKGSVVVYAPPRSAERQAELSYTLTGDPNVVTTRLQKGTITVRYGKLGDAEKPNDAGHDAGHDHGDKPKERLGVTLYEDDNFRGRSETFYSDHANLGRSVIGNDRASSIRIPKGCVVTLFKDDNYRGSSDLLMHDTANLGGTRVGNDSVTSLKVSCESK